MQEDSHDHPILPHPFRWELVEFIYRKCLEDRQRSYVDLVLQRDGVSKRLRFFSPQNLELTEGLPNSHGLQILDVSNRQLDGIKIRVSNFEGSWGAPTFWAQSVIEVDSENGSEE